MDKEQLDKLIQAYGRSMYKAGFRDGFVHADGVELSDSNPKPGDLFNEILNLIDLI